MSLHPDIAAVIAGDSEGCILNQDCLEIMADMPDGCVDAVVTDPPYGIAHDTDYTRFTSGGTLAGLAEERDWSAPIVGDDEPFDPSPLLRFPRVVLFGANCYSDKLPCGSLFIWIKKRDCNLAQLMSDAEVAWFSQGHGVYVHYHEWDGMNKQTERGEARCHPTQKPVAVMAWCIERATAGDIILDPFCGSGTTCVAAKKLGRRWIGIEIDEKYADIARNRVAGTPRPLFVEADTPKQADSTLFP